ncbi:hypothetical protein [Paenibacillus glycinis]|uniref:DUF2802 domain-containing protein n=1 Tax=Paenibacillus glycinis TaxID=2697035 RepID=A0ABW9XIJ7_9BACL|nr:hypothetical protein [Paenibacillus glycinis]NBD22440.1 hypothetical protein [Paenibacillus glycinis]
MEPWQTIMIIGGIAVVCSAVLPRRAAAASGRGSDNQAVRNMETALEQFMENMEADNREIAGLVSKSNQDAQAQAVKRDERIDRLEKRCADLELALAEQTKQAALALLSVPPKPAAIDEAKPAVARQDFTASVLQEEELAELNEPDLSPPSIRVRYAELFDMHQAGKSIDAIAKKLGRNKGEVQLILQLSKQEEAARHE